MRGPAIQFAFSLALLCASQAAHAEFFIEVGVGKVKADSIETGDPIAPRTPAFSDDALTVAIGTKLALGAAPIRISLFKIGAVKDFNNFLWPFEPNTGFSFNGTLETYGATISLNPSWRLTDTWTADAGVGAVYLRQKVKSTYSLASYSHSESALAAIGSAGLSYRFGPTWSTRLGVELSRNYSSATIGLEFGF